MAREIHEVRLIERRGVCDDITVFAFERPDAYEFDAGQYLMLRLAVPGGEETKPFSHASGPEDETIEVATRLSGSTFKNALSQLSPGDLVGVSGPLGRFVLPKPPPPIAFLVGGVGITPIRSMLRGLSASGTAIDAVLVYGNRSPACVPFGSELRALGIEGLRVVDVFERGSGSPEEEIGFIGAQVVGRHVPDLEARLFVTAGPPVMVEAMERVLDELEVPQERRLVERFGRPTSSA